MQSTTGFDSENNSRYALQKAMYLKLKNSWKSEILTWNFPITFCRWVYAIQSSDQHTFQKTFCSCHWWNLTGSSVDPMQLLDTILYWQRAKNNYRLRTGSIFNYCSYLGAPVEDVNIWPVANYKLFLVKSGGATKCSWHFMDIAASSTYIQLQNANEILCWMLQLTQHIQLQNANEDLKWTTSERFPNATKWMKLQKAWHKRIFLYKTTPGWQFVL